MVSSGVTMSVPFALGKVIDIIYSMDQIKTLSKEGKEEDKTDNKTDVKAKIEANLKTVCGVLVGVFAVGAAANFGRVYLMRIISQRITARYTH